MKTQIKIFGLLSLLTPFVSVANTHPSAISVKVYQVWVSTSGLCTDPVLAIDNGSNPPYVDFLGTDTQLGNGSLSDGTYPCVMIKMSSIIKFVPSANDGALCAAGVEASLDVCSNNDPFTHPDGTTGNCSNTYGVEETITLHLSTFAAGGGGANCWQPPTSNGDATRGFNLGSALVVSGATTSTFVVDGIQSPALVDGSDPWARGVCEMEAPTFTFNQ